jgi:hypothetical protein
MRTQLDQRPRLRRPISMRSAATAAALRERWSARSLRSVWPASDAEWGCSAVDALCEGLVASGLTRLDVHRASRSLGEQRAEVGAHLHEARTDLDIVLGLARVGHKRRLELLDALTIGWAEHAVDRLSTSSVMDPRSEMATLDYLMLRLRELYSEAALTGESVTERYVLIVVETDGSAHRLVAETRLAALHSALRYAFVGGESIVAVPPRRALALVARDEPRLSDSLARLRSELKIAVEEGRLPAVHSWRQSLPRDPVELSLTLLGVVD